MSKSPKKPVSNLVECQICHIHYQLKGIGRHRIACARENNSVIQQKKFLKEKELKKKAKDSKKTGLPLLAGSSRRLVVKPWEKFGRLEPDPEDDPIVLASSSADLINEAVPQTSSHDEHQTGPSIDDVKIEHHSHSERPAEILPLKTYQGRRYKIETPKLNTQQPWKPFQTRAEFEFAEVALKAGLSKNQADTLISLMKRCIRGEETFEIDSHAHLCEIWNAGAVLHTSPEKHLISAVYKKDDTRTFDFWSRSLWDWAIEQVTDPFLAPHIQWDAQRLFKFDGNKYIRFVHEPHTADRFWDIQVCTCVL
jgi:hypothetical protein